MTADMNEASGAAALNRPLVIVENEENYGKIRVKSECIVQDESVIDEEFLVKMYQRHFNLPWTIAETERLIIREYSLDDIPNIPEIFRPSREEAASYIENIYKIWQYGIWILTIRATGDIIGRAGIGDNGDIGYEIIPKYRGRGYAAEAVTAIMEYAREELLLEDLFCIIEKDNIPSLCLAEKLGLRIVYK